MDVHGARGDERTIRRVIALLVAFAVLAERAAGRSAPVRLFVLWILRRAEVVAAEFLFVEAGLPPAAPEAIAAVGNGPENALRLAARFTALAAALCALLPAGHLDHRRPARRAFAFGHGVSGSGPRLAGRMRAPYDTS